LKILGGVGMKRKILTVILTIAIAAGSLLIPLAAYAEQGTNTVIPVNTPYVDNLSERNEVDIFRFSISEPGSLQVRFEFDIKGDYNVEVYQVRSTGGDGFNTKHIL